MAFELAAEGRRDREVAKVLNAAGYTTAGNQGNRAFSKDTVAKMLQNRFYLGELPVFDEQDRLTGWTMGKHDSFISEELFQKAQAARELNRKNPARTTRSDARVSSLSGVARCGGCGATLRSYRQRWVVRLVCNTRLKNGGCSEKSARLDAYETTLEAYLGAFIIPEDYQHRLLEAHHRVHQAYEDID